MVLQLEYETEDCYMEDTYLPMSEDNCYLTQSTFLSKEYDGTLSSENVEVCDCNRSTSSTSSDEDDDVIHDNCRLHDLDDVSSVDGTRR